MEFLCPSNYFLIEGHRRSPPDAGHKCLWSECAVFSDHFVKVLSLSYNIINEFTYLLHNKQNNPFDGVSLQFSYTKNRQTSPPVAQPAPAARDGYVEASN